MLSSSKGGFRLLPTVDSPKYIVFSDFDETYYPHEMTNERQKALYELEDYLEEKSQQGLLLIGWVTGSSLESILHKMEKGNFRSFPHFIASDLGTEITYFLDHNFLLQDLDWQSTIDQTNFNKKNIDEIISLLNKEDIELSPQTQLGSSRYKKNFYYRSSMNTKMDKRNLSKIKEVVKKFGLNVNINRCNPLAGDPEDSYDIDFIPTGTGKDEIVRFMLEKYKVHPEYAIAFGDSGNDLKMLKAVKHGYLVENAVKEAKDNHTHISTGPYSQGIMNTLKSIIQ